MRKPKNKVIRACFSMAAMLGIAVSGPVVAAEISFSDIMKNPDNLELNFDYAVQKIEAGDMISAAAALERVLLVDPDWHEARLLYAVVLYRMDNLDSASTELELLKDVVFPPATAADYDYYVDRVAQARKTSDFDGQIVLGFSYDDTVLGTLSDIFGFVNAEGDGATTASARLSWRHELSAAKELDFVANLRAYTKQYFDFDDFSYAVFQADAGLKGAVDKFDWQALAVARTVRVDGERYVNSMGAKFDISRDLSAQTTLGLSLGYNDLDYDNITVAGFPTFAEEGRSGDEMIEKISITHKIDPRNTLMFALGATQRDADVDAFAYDAFQVEAAYAHEWGKGVYSDFEYAFQNREYDDFFSREEDLHYARASLGVPLRILWPGGERPTLKQIEQMSIETSIYHERREADSVFFEYDNTGADIRLVWGFGK